MVTPKTLRALAAFDLENFALAAGRFPENAKADWQKIRPFRYAGMFWFGVGAAVIPARSKMDGHAPDPGAAEKMAAHLAEAERLAGLPFDIVDDGEFTNKAATYHVFRWLNGNSKRVAVNPRVWPLLSGLKLKCASVEGPIFGYGSFGQIVAVVMVVREPQGLNP